MKTTAILGYPGSGKTWAVFEFVKFLCPTITPEIHFTQTKKVGLVEFHDFDDVVVLGRYDGTMFQGTDRLSMAVAPHFELFFQMMVDRKVKHVIGEGDRINCMPFFKAALACGQLERIKLDTPPMVLLERRNKRTEENDGKAQPAQFLKSVASKVDKHTFDLSFRDNAELLRHLIRMTR